MRLLETRRFEDERGWFCESYSARNLAEAGVDTVFLQDNHSYSQAAGTVRGLHFQLPPHDQAKLVRCTRGAVFDVAVDIRQGSPTFGRWVGVELSAANGRQLFVPAGFAHGFATLQPDTELQYKVDRYYAPQHDAGIRWDDPDLAIDWHLPMGVTPTLSRKDAVLPALAAFVSPFAYDGRPLTLLGDHPGA